MRGARDAASRRQRVRKRPSSWGYPNRDYPRYRDDLSDVALCISPNHPCYPDAVPDQTIEILTPDFLRKTAR